MYPIINVRAASHTMTELETSVKKIYIVWTGKNFIEGASSLQCVLNTKQLIVIAYAL